MSKLSKLLTKQESGTSKWWGRLKLLGSQIGVYATVLTLMFAATGTYSTSIKPFLAEYGINLPFILYIVAIIVILGLLLIFEYKITLPGYFSLYNQQVYRHDNPIVRDLRELKKELKEIKKMLKDKK